MPQWVNRNGLYIPERVEMAKRLEQAQRERTSRGRFFSTFAYSHGSSLSYGYTKPADTLPFEILRQARDKSLIDKIIINARVTQMKHIAKRVIVPGKQVGFRVVHENYADPNYKPTEDVIRRCKEMERIIDNVNTDIHPGGFRDFAAIAVDQELTYDRKAMVKIRDRTGNPIRYHLVDATTIRPSLLVLHEFMRDKKIDNEYRAFESYYKETGIDLSTAAFIQIVDGVPVASWTKDEMSVDITNPSVEINKWAYGAGSCLEQSIAATITWLNAWAYNDGLFNQNSPESMLFLYGDYDPIGLEAFQRQILDQTGSGDYQKIPVIPADEGFKAELIKIRELPKDIQFAEMMRIIIQLKTAAYRAHPSIVNFSIDKGGPGGLSIGNNSEEELINRTHEEGFESLCHSLASWLTRTIIKPRYDDLVMIFDVDTEDEVRRIEVLKKQTEIGMTFNQALNAMGINEKLPYGDVPNNPNYIRAMELQMQMEGMIKKPENKEQVEGNEQLEDPQEVPEQGEVKKSLRKDDKFFVIEIIED
jgi:hypothetical protein